MKYENVENNKRLKHKNIYNKNNGNMKNAVSILTALLITFCKFNGLAYSHLSTYSYCAGNPTNCIDPTGCIVQGVTKNDASMIVQDFRDMFPSDEFSKFRNLIVQNGKKQNGKSLAPIASEALSDALSGVKLDEDQQALIEIMVNTINSGDTHIIEYLSPGKNMSTNSLKIYEPLLNQMGITSEIAANTDGGYVTYVNALCGEASTAQMTNGSLTLIKTDPCAFLTNRPATLGHEVFGHGRSYRLGYTDAQSQHVIPIQIENLILRNMRQSNFRNGTDHAPLNSFITNFMAIPICR